MCHVLVTAKLFFLEFETEFIIVKKLMVIKKISLFNIYLSGRNFIFNPYLFRKHIKIFRLASMPKIRTVSAELKEARLKNSKHKFLYPPGEVYMCVLGNGANSSARALYMFTDHERYLFNCGEGTQRLAHEHKMKLAKLNHIFITHKSWKNVGGLLGVALTVQDIGVPELNLHGPHNIESLFESAQGFIITKDLKIVKRNENEGHHSDTCMDVYYIKISASADKMPENCSVDDAGEYWTDPEKSKKMRLSNVKQVPNETISYVCKGQKKKGHLLLEKCVEQGVPPGPLLGDLKNGKDVTLPSGKIVYSKDVVAPDEVCPVFLVVECPSDEFLDPFVNEEKFKAYQKDAPEPSDIASLVVHFTESDILNTEKYQQWMKRFPDKTCHLVLNSDNASLNSVAVHKIQHQLHLLHPEVFPLLQENEENSRKAAVNKNIIQAKTLDRYYLRPDKGYDGSFGLSIDAEEFIEEAKSMEGFKENLCILKDCIKLNSHSSKGIMYPEVVFLGTGSSIPSKVRNVSSILIKTSERNYIMLDCGEGTCSQLMRMYGSNYKVVLSQVFCIFVSHMHADHHLGLIKLLQFREAAVKALSSELEPFLIVGPKRLKCWLADYDKMFERISHLYKFIECSSLKYQKENSQVVQFSDWETCPDIILQTVPVDHCYDAHGAILTEKESKWKLVYSGDTMPCERIVYAGKDCSLLIHEATMEDELAEEAVLKKHSTTSDAIKIGTKMNSQCTILTHFSQRYAKIPIFNENFHNRVGCAFDNMRICYGNLHIIPLFIPVLKCLFAEYVEELQERGNKRRKRLELLNSSTDTSVL